MGKLSWKYNRKSYDFLYLSNLRTRLCQPQRKGAGIVRKVVERRKQVDQIEVRAGVEAGAVLVAEAVAVVGKSFYLF